MLIKGMIASFSAKLLPGALHSKKYLLLTSLLNSNDPQHNQFQFSQYRDQVYPVAEPLFDHAGRDGRVVRPIPEGADHVAAIGENRKLLIFALDALPEMARGQGIMLQKYKDGGLSDALAFKLDERLSWAMGGDTGRTRTETELGDWIGNRGTAGRMPPRGFPQDNRFG